MSTIRLKVEAFAGTTIEEACRDLCALADRVGILCEVPFNGVKVWAYPGTDPAQLAKSWGMQMKRPEHLYRIASARPAGVMVAPAPGPEPIPDRVYWAPLADNFYDADGRGRGNDFYRKWKPRCAEFPQGESFGWGKGSAHNPFKDPPRTSGVNPSHGSRA